MPRRFSTSGCFRWTRSLQTSLIVDSIPPISLTGKDVKINSLDITSFHSSPSTSPATTKPDAHLSFLSDFFGVVKFLDLLLISCPTPSFFSSLKIAIESCVDSRLSFFFTFFLAEVDLTALAEVLPVPSPDSGVRGASAAASRLAAGDAGALCVTNFRAD